MEPQANNNSSSNPKPSEAPVLNISGKADPAHPTIPFVPEPPKISPTSFPYIIGRILLKTNDPPAPVGKVNLSGFEQCLCLLVMEKPSSRKLVYHMFVSNKEELEEDYLKVRKIYENKKDIKILEQITLDTLCARTLYRRVQKKLTDVEWNKQRNIFEIAKIRNRDVWNLSQKIYQLDIEEMEKLFNYTKFLSATNS